MNPPFVTSLTIQAQWYHLYQANPGDGNYTQQAVPGATCNFVPLGGVPSTLYGVGVLTAGIPFSCTNSISATFNPGDLGFWVITATSSGSSPNTTLGTIYLDLSLSLSQ